MMLGRLERRVLGGVRFTDAVTGQPIERELVVVAEGVRWIRNRSGTYVVTHAPGLTAHTEAFLAPPSEPALGSVVLEVRVKDPRQRFMSRRSMVSLPRDPDPAHAEAPASLFTATDIELFPSATAPIWPGWAVQRVSVAHPTDDGGLAGALIRVVRASDDARIGGGMTDARGEALVAVHGIPVTTFSADGGPVLETEVAARLEVVWDPDDHTGHRWPDPDDLEARHASLVVSTKDVQLASGRHAVVTL